jgi:hypothetical protein
VAKLTTTDDAAVLTEEGGGAEVRHGVVGLVDPAASGRRRVGLVKERPQQLLLTQPRHAGAPGGHALAEALGFGQVGEEVLATASAVSRVPRFRALRRLVCGHRLVTAFRGPSAASGRRVV